MNPPPGVSPALGRAPMVVVRRAPTIGDQLPAGIGGRTAAKVRGLSVVTAGYDERIIPEQLAATQAWTRSQRLRHIGNPGAGGDSSTSPSQRTLPGTNRQRGVRTGAASPRPHTSSDLDLLVRAPQPICFKKAQALPPIWRKHRSLLMCRSKRPMALLHSLNMSNEDQTARQRCFYAPTRVPRLVCNPWTNV